MTLDTPLVSICSITYNHAQYIRECLDGFLMQKTKFPYEIIINDDCSTDGTTEIIKEYAEKYPNIIRSIFHEENQYQKGVRGMFQQFVIPKARGKYVAFCEGDDYWTDPLKLQKQVDFLENNPEYGLVYSDFIGYNVKKGCEVNMNIENLSGNLYETILREKHNVWTLTVCIRTELLKNIPKIDKSKYFIGDRLIFMTVLSRSLAHCVYEKTAVYRILESSASHITNLRNRLEFRVQCCRTNDYCMMHGPDVGKETYEIVKRNLAKALIAKAYYCGEHDLMQEVEFPLRRISSFKDIGFYLFSFGKNKIVYRIAMKMMKLIKFA